MRILSIGLSLALMASPAFAGCWPYEESCAVLDLQYQVRQLQFEVDQLNGVYYSDRAYQTRTNWSWQKWQSPVREQPSPQPAKPTDYPATILKESSE